MAAGGHFRAVCEHGRLVTQCRCPARDKRVEVVPCPFGCEEIDPAERLRATIHRRSPDPARPWVWQVYRVEAGGQRTVLTGGARASWAAAAAAAGTFLEMRRDMRQLRRSVRLR